MTAFSPLLNQQNILTVSALNRLTREVLEQTFGLLWVSGEVSNFTRAASGHWYFSLKDATAQVRCVMFKGRNSYSDFIPKEGEQVEMRCNLTMYEARGEFQLNVEFIQRAGLGRLFEAFEALKTKLANEGLFDAARKKSVPLYPKRLGIVTSLDAAALHDVLTTLQRRNPLLEVIVYPSMVQGKTAAQEISRAIQTASQRNEVDVLIICRGGGSMEDLWSFNEEIVARAIAECALPTISGVGHETDFTIADFVADARAATPTAAAEIATQAQVNQRQQLQQLGEQLQKAINRQLQHKNQHLDYLSRRLVSPQQQLQQQQNTLKQLAHRLKTGMAQHLQLQHHKLQNLSQNLSHLNPNAVLGRGYAFVQTENGTLVRDSAQLSPAQTIHITLQRGKIKATVNESLP